MFLVNLFPRSVPRGQNTYYKERGKPGLVDDLLEDALVDYDREAMEDLGYKVKSIFTIEDLGITKEEIEEFERKVQLGEIVG